MSETLVATAEQVTKLFGSTEQVDPEAWRGDAFMTPAGVEVQFGDSRLGVVNNPNDGDEIFRITGNTVPRLCGALGASCAKGCGLADRAMSMAARQAQDCASANATRAFQGQPGFMVAQTNNEVVFLSDKNSYNDVTMRDENGTKRTIFGKTKPGAVLVIAESDIPENAETGIFIGANNADNSFGIATFALGGERYALTFSSTRLNLGDRDQDAQILRKAIDGILDRQEIFGDERARMIADLQVQIDIGYSAGIDDFAFDIKIPKYEPSEELAHIDIRKLTPEQIQSLSVESQNARYLLLANGHIDENGNIKEGDAGRIKPSEFMDFWYPGALDNGEIIGHPEVELRLYTPRTKEGCPGDGELCHVDYVKITRRTLKTQLIEMGIPEDNIIYNTDRIINTASSDNRLASNRAMDLVGIPVPKTLRSVNGAMVAFPQLAA